MSRSPEPEALLEPLGPEHAEAMWAVVSEPALYRYLDYGPPPSAEYLRDLYARRGMCSRRVVPGKGEAWIAYVLGAKHQGRGHATRACRALMAHVDADYAVARWLATAEHDDAASIAVLGRLGFRPARPEEQEGRDLTQSERLFLKP